MSAALKRDQACARAKTEPERALATAREIDDPWYRCQALAWALRYTPRDPLTIARELAKAAETCDDEYKRVSVRAWEIAALAERGLAAEAGKSLAASLKRCREIQPPSSRAEAFVLLLQASLALPKRESEAVARQLFASCDAKEHWRCARALCDAVELVVRKDAGLAKDLVASIKDASIKEKAERLLLAGGREGRAFFG